jgi:hypothetical protein
VHAVSCVVLLAIVVFLVFGCEEDSVRVDLVPPAVVEDLRGFARDSSSILLTWTAPGDDGEEGRAALYDLRTSLSLSDSWEEMLPISGEPPPREGGSPDSFLVGGLVPQETYYFRLSAGDEAFNWSEPSEVASATTLQGVDRTPPGQVTTLAVVRIEPTRMLLNWRAPGDDGFRGRARAYDVRYWTSDVPSWEEAIPVEGEPLPGTALETDSVWVEGLETNSEYLFALRASDEVENWSSISNIVTETTAYPEDLQWSDGFALPPAGQGIVESVHALIVHEGALIAAGLFTRAGDRWARNIARWNGESWSALGDGTNGPIRHMTIFEGDLIVSGSFSGAGRVPAKRIARWNGTAWDAMGEGGEDGPLAVWDGHLIAQIGSSPDTLGRWTGSGWVALPPSPLYYVEDLAVHGGNLVACGVGATSETVSFVASFDGSSWRRLLTREAGQTTQDFLAHALLADGDQLYVGTTPDLGQVHLWNGSSWSRIGSGLVSAGREPEGVLGLCGHGNRVFAVGEISNVVGRRAPAIARWNGSAWEPLGSGLDRDEPWFDHGPVARAVAGFDGSLYVGGTFDEAGRRPSSNIARWRE